MSFLFVHGTEFTKTKHGGAGEGLWMQGEEPDGRGESGLDRGHYHRPSEDFLLSLFLSLFPPNAVGVM